MNTKTYITKYGKEETAKAKAKLADLLVQRIKLDQFFDKYLEMFEGKMKPDQSDTPVWKLYRAKYAEYDKLCSEIQTTEHVLKKAVNV